jgi:hypothetical protein
MMQFFIEDLYLWFTRTYATQIRRYREPWYCGPTHRRTAPSTSRSETTTGASSPPFYFVHRTSFTTGCQFFDEAEFAWKPRRDWIAGRLSQTG